MYSKIHINIKNLKCKYPNTLVTSNVNEIFNDKNIDLVVLAVLNSIHFKLAKAALENSKNLIVENHLQLLQKKLMSF